MSRHDDHRAGRRPRLRAAAVAAAGAIVGTLATLPGTADAIVTKPHFVVTSRVSVTSTGGQMSSGFEPHLTPDDRYVVMTVTAPSVTGAGTHAVIVRKDLWSGDVVLVSAAATKGATPNGDSSQAVVSDDGKWVAFVSSATNLVASDTNGHQDVFLRNLDVGTTQLLSVSSGGVQANADSLDPDMDAAGDKVVFDSAATNLVSGDTNGQSDIFVRSWLAGTTTRASVSTASAQSNGQSNLASISGDGNSVAFVSYATNLVTGDTNGQYDVFLRSLAASTTIRVSINGSTQGDGASGTPAISNDGSYVAFTSQATNLVSGDTNGQSDAFRWTRSTKAIQRVSVNAFGGQVADGSFLGDAISRNGNIVVWSSKGDDVTLPAGDGSSVNVYTRDVASSFTQLIDVRPDGNPGTSNFTLDLATDQFGRMVAYESTATDLVRHDTNNNYDAFVTDTDLTIGPFLTISAFVSQQYQDFVGRAPSAAELAEGIAVITNGELSPDRYLIARSLAAPFATDRAPVMRLYWAYFHREPDAGGFTYWVNKHHGGKSLNAISQSFSASSEFKNTYGSLDNTAFVKLVYVNVLGRQPDSAGHAHWVAKLDTKALTRGAVMVQFSESSEGIRVISPETDTVLLELGMMRALPTKADFDFWRGELGSPAIPYELADALFTSAAYAARFP